MYKSLLALLFMSNLIISVSTQSQNIRVFGSKGTWEFGGSIFYARSTQVNNGVLSDPAGLFQMQPLAGYFVYNGIEIGVQPTITITSASGSSFTQMGLYFAPSYNFSLKSKFYPNIKALIGYTSQSGTDVVTATGFSWGGEGGIKINLLGNSLLTLSIQYRRDTYNSSGSSGRSGFNILTFGAGWNVYF